MIDLYFSPTPNGLKIRLILEETGLPYRIVPVRLSAGEQFAPAFLALSPNGKIPVIVDHAPRDSAGPIPVFESGAILLYLAEKTGQLLPEDGRARLEALQWLFWQVSGLGPMAGPGRLLPDLCTAAGARGDRALYAGTAPPLRRARSQARGQGLPRR